MLARTPRQLSLRALERRGRVFADRYHARALTSPREVRHALVYVLQNHKKHGTDSRTIDACSSAPWFTGWQNHPARLPAGVSTPPGVLTPVAAAHTWLRRVGWRRHGLIAPGECPRRA